jgi:sialate O-acetylesterase
MNYKCLPLIFLSLLLFQIVKAEVRLPNVFSSNMILQCDKAVPVWGWALPGETISVRFAGQRFKTTADTKGSWKVMLVPMKPSFEKREMTIAGTNTIVLSDVLVGEVWLCSGQSNMEYTMALMRGYKLPKKGVDSAALELSKSYPSIRLFKVEKVLSTPDVTTSGWHVASDSALAKISAAGFFFAKDLQQQLKVPVGIISSSWGGSRIEPWTPAEAYMALPAFAKAKATIPFEIDSVRPGKNYRSMIQPLAPFAIRGVLWYQGESNCMIHDGMRYADKMQALVEGWRKEWNDKSLPFYSVLIAPYYYTHRKDHLQHTPETLPEFWEAQFQSTKIPNTDIIVVTDLVDYLSEIHPSYKWDVGRRLSLVALADTYHKKMESTGPVFKSMKIKDGKAILSFDHALGLKSSNGEPLSWFSVAAADGNFVPAQAIIIGQQLIVSAPSIDKPSMVRFAWNETAMPNLVNGAGLPAVPFRTDGVIWTYRKSN